MAGITTYYNGLTRQGDVMLGIETTTATFPAYATVVSTAESLDNLSYYYFSLERDSRFNSADYPTEFFDEIETDLGITLVDGDVFIATPVQDGLTKELRQKQKLDIAAAKRATDGNPRATYDLTTLPTQYNDDDIVNNPNVGGLVVGRPWIETVSAFTFYEAFGTTEAISTTQYVSGNKIYAQSSTYDVSETPPARVVVNDIELVNVSEGNRGHTLLVLNTYGEAINYYTFDTYLEPNAASLTALASALNAIAAGNIAVLVTYDATALDAGVRTAINTGYGSTNSDTWTSQRKSHIFIGIKQ